MSENKASSGDPATEPDFITGPEPAPEPDPVTEPALVTEPELTTEPPAELQEPRVAAPVEVLADGVADEAMLDGGAGGVAASAVESDILVTDGEFFTPNYDAADEQAIAAPERRRTPILGLAAFGATLIIGVIVGIAIAVAVDDQYELALGLAIVAIVGSILSFLVGVAAVILRQGRWWGVAAMVLSVIVNPLSLIQILDLFSWN